MMKALVTGGTGFVGGHLIRQLREQGDTVRALVRPTSHRSVLESLSAESVVGDLDDHDSLRRACEGCDIVYHSAARVEMVGTEEEFHRTTVAGTERLLTAAAQQGVKRFVHVSSCGVYHPKIFATGRVINEFTPTPEPPAWFPYGRAKLLAEHSVREQCPPEMEWVIIRLGYLYGPGNRAMRTHVEPAMRDSTMHIIGDGQNEMAFVYVSDAVRAVVLAGRCLEAAGKILIAGCNEWITQQEYFDAMADGFGIPRIKKRMPYSIAFFFGWLGELLIRSGPRRTALRRAAIALTGLPQRLRCDYTQELLNWQPEVEFPEGIRAAFDWYREEYGRRENDSG
ncbi:MAG: NAD-dependent epimerase/dehydratase family protein [Phycisphaerales bacterium]|nr:NAD-dependent epimerase/dehydratase family protein [Phycisphaerales bacterium]